MKNRTIEFRAKRIIDGEWMYGFYYQSYHESVIVNCEGYREVDSDTVGQFTSLRDKNGVKIFEGDLLVDTVPVDNMDSTIGYFHSFFPVVWCDKTAQWCIDYSFAGDGSQLVGIVDYFVDNLEVKGNIHEK